MSRISRVLPILVLAIFVLSMIPLMPAHAAIAITSLEDTDGDPVVDGDKGDTVVVNGYGVVAGKTVNLYWDLVQAWDGEDGLLNSTTADAYGEFEVWFDVPEAVWGHHRIHVEDEFGASFASADFDVFSKVRVSPDTGLWMDEVTVKGYGFHGDGTVFILFNDTATGTAQTDVNVIEGNDIETHFNGTLTETPVRPGTVVLYNGTATWNITENGDGILAGTFVDSGSINYDTGEWELEFTAAPSVTGVGFDVDYESFEDVIDDLKVLAAGVATDQVGSFSKNVTIPEYVMGSYDIWVYDSKGAYASDRFDLAPVIELVPDSGPVGAVIMAKGRGFGDREYITSITLGGIDCYNTSEVKTSSRGAFTISFVVPSVPDEDDYDVVITDATAISAFEEFEVTGLPKIKLTPSYGGPMEIVQIQGWNFTQIWDTEVNVNFTNGIDTYIDTYATNGDGEFSGPLQVPLMADGDYTVNASIVYHMINATTVFRLGFILTHIHPVSGAEGTKVTIDGIGFTADGKWNATLGNEDVVYDDYVDPTGRITSSFFIPNIGVGTHDLIVMDIDTEIEVVTEITVTDETYLVLRPPSAVNEYNITVSGYHFSDDENAALDFELYNTTAYGEIDWTWDISADVYYYDPDEDIYMADPVELNADGNFTGWWTVYEDVEISLGNYWLNVTDDNDLFAQIRVNVIRANELISARANQIPTMDGVISDSEWLDAYPNLIMLFSHEGKEDINSVELHIKNDKENIYFAFRILDPMHKKLLILRFADNQGNWDAKYSHSDEGEWDRYWNGTGWDTEEHVDHVVTWNTEGDYRIVEGMIPLDSGDGYDMSVTAGEIIRCGIRYGLENETRVYPSTYKYNQSDTWGFLQTARADLVEPPSDLGVVCVGSDAVLGFGADFEATQSMAIIIVDYNDTAFTYAGYTAEMDGADASEQFDVDIGAGTLTLNCSSLQPANGTLSVELTFRAEAAGNHTFDWRYVYVAFQEPPDPPATVDESGTTVVEAIHGMEVPLYAGWNLIGVPSNLVDPSVEGVFSGNLSRVEYVYGFDNEAKDYVYWINGLPPEYQTLELMEPGKGYWAYVNENFTQVIQYLPS